MIARVQLNCWEEKKCGREPGGNKISEFGVCPASIEKRTNGLNDGKCGGRACWAIVGTMCNGKVQGTYAAKLGNCLNCEHYKKVIVDQGALFVNSQQILACLNNVLIEEDSIKS
ncbi:MAG: hypothetical protein UU65_C0003G0013 [candidate division CPR2 bacterium GW2011_GWC1_41_48]|uniref:Uncharacterized protein n=1 Tax=candidate division CPR2 bacterium GW2011_GWC1_41_48 TaxID=1618344 RepID=A0A0G0Z7E1_UNCC2|nr:MAG: hypothetical protein UT47_C0003G0019 [candidate division CPR2 bacterium GW2011_GWC2_39_35]KKR28889.1 MAG: hypothetical protein UT60_C0010G0007 [candidate division CPR2 bacterium GW2011_GWD2_39_7]KKR29536.1 MAG: hypothetical protein UT59_C0006G0010 [candidate division CPR2 bacterium GW2011_GWD1_39_7]KKS08958.1 MAG: hypothetical protein UU65_C0003G0013 [candidate division CPR2 bacterium GW2011_GWC1_41_48]OGB55749.1 MAG: hypothetical protein A2Y27_01115 [candidate division CPR2 bacterium G